jgi:predicted Zn-dependent protease with MMP-like domain
VGYRFLEKSEIEGMNKERFEELVFEAIESLPEEFGQKMENIDVVVEELPSQAQLKRSRVGKNMTLLGLYEGVPLTQRTSNYGLVAPDKITIFQKTIEEHCDSKEEIDIKEQIRKTLLHEIAHHFGIGDARLKEIEKERKRQK